MDKKKHEWSSIENFIIEVLLKVRSTLSIEEINAVEHYLKHSEFEIAFEGLFIEIMKMKTPSIIDYKKSKEIAEVLRLNEESVFDSDFWIKFERYVNANIS